MSGSSRRRPENRSALPAGKHGRNRRDSRPEPQPAALAKAALAEILGVEPDIPFGLAEATPSAIDVPDDPFSALDYAIAHRPELAGVREKLRRSKMAVDASRAGYLPQVDFMTRYYADDPEMKYSTDRDNWTAGLYLNWKIFDGFATRSDRAEALSHLQEIMAADRKTLLAVKFDVKKAYLNLNEAQERLKVATSSVQTARETYQLIKRQYEGGSVGITRYLEAELAFNRARMRETTAYFDREKARAQIARAIGYWTGSRETAPRKDNPDERLAGKPAQGGIEKEFHRFATGLCIAVIWMLLGGCDKIEPGTFTAVEKAPFTPAQTAVAELRRDRPGLRSRRHGAPQNRNPHRSPGHRPGAGCTGQPRGPGRQRQPVDFPGQPADDIAPGSGQAGIENR
jgi:hypothetical protein